MKVIHKYDLPDRLESIMMPRDAEILCVQTQNGYPVIWAIVDPENHTEERFFEIVGTGETLYTDMGVERKYIGTFQLHNGSYVGHVFERIN
jgi:hypothetical protein